MTLSVAEKIPGFLLRPVETFRAVREETVGDAVTYFVVLLLVNAVLSAIVGFLGFRALGMPGAGITGAGGIGLMLVAFLFAVVAGIIGLVVGSILLHIGVLIMGGHGGFVQTFKAVVYGLTPYYLFGWVPIIGGLAGIWGLIVEIVGVRELHEMTSGQAVIAWLISLMIVLVIVAILIVILGALFFAIVGIASSSGGPLPPITVVSP